jgi:hypothetical protein
VPPNKSTDTLISVSTTGGVTGIGAVDLENQAGTGTFGIEADRCSFTLFPVSDGDSCDIFVSAATADSTGTATTADLVIHTSSGDQSVALSMTGGAALPPPTPPLRLHGTSGSREVFLTWAGVANDGGEPVQEYLFEESADGGSTWTPAGAFTDFDAQIRQTVTGLANGITYKFRERAENGLGTSDPSNVISLTPEKLKSSFILWSGADIKAGKTATLSSRLVAPEPPILHQIQGIQTTIDLLAKVAPSKTYRTVRKYLTPKDGTIEIRVSPSYNTTYELQYEGSVDFTPATSKPVEVRVTPVVSVSLSNNSISIGKTVLVYGTVRPTDRGQTVRIEVGGLPGAGGGSKLLNGAKIKKQRMPNGKVEVGFVIKYRPRTRGVFRIGAAVPYNPRNDDSFTNSKRLTVH